MRPIFLSSLRLSAAAFLEALSTSSPNLPGALTSGFEPQIDDLIQGLLDKLQTFDNAGFI